MSRTPRRLTADSARLAPMKPRIVVRTHSRVGDASLITAEATFIRDMQERVARLKKSGVSAAEAVQHFLIEE